MGSLDNTRTKSDKRWQEETEVFRDETCPTCNIVHHCYIRTALRKNSVPRGVGQNAL